MYKKFGAGLLFSMLWATGSIAVKFGVHSADALMLACIRFIITGLLFLPYYGLYKKERFWPNKEEWKSIFKNRGINIEKIKALPENIHNLSRKDEIINWFHLNNHHEEFIIIDDDKSLNELPDFLKKNLIQTSAHIGFTEEHLKAIKSILGKDLQPV